MERLQELEKFITSALPLQQSNMQSFLSIWKYFDSPRKTILTRTGETERYL